MIISTPTITLMTIPTTVPTTLPTPDTADSRVSFFARAISKPNAPINGPSNNPNGRKNIPTIPPNKDPIAPHLLPPNHLEPNDPLMISKVWEIAIRITKIPKPHQAIPASGPTINRYATAAKRINKCPGNAGNTQPIKPTINKLPVTNHTALF